MIQFQRQATLKGIQKLSRSGVFTPVEVLGKISEFLVLWQYIAAAGGAGAWLAGRCEIGFGGVHWAWPADERGSMVHVRAGSEHGRMALTF
jgi:hypothetical protein